jgi:uncharacterized membrane protein
MPCVPASRPPQRLAFATKAIGEILGLVIATALGWSNVPSIAIAVVLAFFFGYALTLRPLIRGGVPFRQAARVALAADTASIAVMEIVDNACGVSLSACSSPFGPPSR